MYLLGGKTPGSRVPYDTVKVMIADRREEMKGLGWSSFEHIMKAAYKVGVVEEVNIGGKSKFLKLLLPAPQRVTSNTIDPMEYPPKHRPLVSTMLKLAHGKIHEGMSTEMLAQELGQAHPHPGGDYFFISQGDEYGILTTGHYIKDVAWVYLNLPPDHPVSPSLLKSPTTSPPPRSSLVSLPLPREPKPVERRPAPPKNVPPPSKKGPFRSRKRAPSKQAARHRPPARKTPNQPTARTSPTLQHLADETTFSSWSTLPSSFKQRVLAALNKASGEEVETRAPIDEFLNLLKLEYPWSTDEFLYSIVGMAEEAEVMGRDMDSEDVVWIALI